MTTLTLNSLAATTALAKAMATCAAQAAPPAILMRGALGAGKTTFISAVVTALPGAHMAEVSSPSFTLVNLYPTSPAVAHVDLYRTGGLGLDADVEDILNDPQYWCLMEWAEYLPASCIPAAYVAMDWTVTHAQRVIRLHAQGLAACAFLDCVRAGFATWQDTP
ncbi:tRNA (adenosine(37)-N6)-threonylcarbamoyltransferase complex ATPase subunit type 1 TsaE [Desulfovibrionales bacterium]